MAKLNASFSSVKGQKESFQAPADEKPGKSAAEVAASGPDGCMMPPSNCLPRPIPAKALDLLVALALERFNGRPNHGFIVNVGRTLPRPARGTPRWYPTASKTFGEATEAYAWPRSLGPIAVSRCSSSRLRRFCISHVRG